MAKTAQTSGEALQSYIDKYQTNPFSVSKDIKFNYKTLLDILKERARITVPTALKLSKYFGTTTKYWLDIQNNSEIEKLTADKKFSSVLKNIPKAEVAKVAPRGRKPGRKTNTIAGKRKKAAAVPGARGAKGAKGKRK